MGLNPLSQLEVEQEIQRQVSELKILTVSLVQRSADASIADANYKVSYSKAYLTALSMLDKPTVAQCEHWATNECAELLFEKNRTAALLEAAKEKGRNVRATLDALRSICANLREAVVHDV